MLPIVLLLNLRTVSALLHFSEQVLLVDLYRRVTVVDRQRHFLELVIQDGVEHVSVAAICNRSQLVVVPHLAEHALDVTVAIAAAVR